MGRLDGELGEAVNLLLSGSGSGRVSLSDDAPKRPREIRGDANREREGGGARDP